MALSNFSFEKLWTNPTDFPTYESDESKVRADMQELPDELKDALNELIDALSAATGASEIGSSTIGLTGATVQATLDTISTMLAARYTKTETDELVKENTDLTIVEAELDSETGTFTFTHKDESTTVIETLLGKIAVSGKLVRDGDSVYLVITNADGTETRTEISDVLNVERFHLPYHSDTDDYTDEEIEYFQHVIEKLNLESTVLADKDFVVVLEDGDIAYASEVSVTDVDDVTYLQYTFVADGELHNMSVTSEGVIDDTLSGYDVAASTLDDTTPDIQAASAKAVKDYVSDVKEEIDEDIKPMRVTAGETTGTDTAYVLADDKFVLYDGAPIRFKLHVDSGATPTINVNNTGAKPIMQTARKALTKGIAGTWMTAVYCEDLDFFILQGSGNTSSSTETTFQRMMMNTWSRRY